MSSSIDGTIKIWSLIHRALLLTIFIGKDGEWIAWTPEGFFECSGNGTKYIGYVLPAESGKNLEYINIEQLYNTFYRPDLVAKKLSMKDIVLIKDYQAINIDEILRKFPPSVKIVTTARTKTVQDRKYKLRVELTDRGGGIGKIIYRVNGVTINTDDKHRGVAVKAKKRKKTVIERKISLQPGKNVVQVTAYNFSNEVESKPATKELMLVDQKAIKPSLYIMAIGINKYRDRSLWLSYAVTDAEALTSLLEKTGTGLFQDIYIHKVLDEDATAKGITDSFSRISKRMKPHDVFVLYLAGHGYCIDGKYHFIPWELVYSGDKSIKDTALSQGQLEKLLSTIPALKSVILVDTCSSGALVKQFKRGLAEKAALNKLMRATGRVTIVASTDAQAALEGNNGHGVFTHTLLSGLKGAADRNGNQNGETSVNELSEFVSENVPEITMKRWGYEQFPMQNLQGMVFPIGLVQNQ